MASQAWLWTLYDHVKENPRDELFAYFRGPGKNDLTTYIVNEVDQLLKAVFPPQSSVAVSPHPRNRSVHMDHSLCAKQLYYCVLEHMLQQNFPVQQDPGAEASLRRFKARARPPAAPGATEALDHRDLHCSLLVCALEIVAAVSLQDDNKQFPWAMRRAGRDNCGASLWMAINCFLECFDKGSAHPMPEELQQYLHNIQTVLLESFVMATGSTLYEHISTQGGGFMYDENDSTLLRQVMAAYATLAVMRTVEVAATLLEGLPQAQKPVTVPAWPLRCAAVMDALLRDNLELCFGQHLSVVVACVVYVVAKVDKVSVTFKRITQVILELVPWCNEAIFTHAEVSPPTTGAADSAQVGDIREFYNSRFIGDIGPVARRVCAALDAGTGAAAAMPERVAESAGTSAAAGSAGAAAASSVQLPQRGTAKSRVLLLGTSEGKENEPESSQPEVSLLAWQQTQVTQQVTAPFAQFLSPARVTPHSVQLGRLLQGSMGARQGTPSRASSMR